MWYKIKITREAEVKGKNKNITEYYLADKDNFAEAGYAVMQEHNGECEIEDVCLLKNYKPLGNVRYNDENKVFIVKFAEDFMMEDGSVKTQKYPVPFYASNNTELQAILDAYMKQGLQGMRVISVTETTWQIIL